MSTQVATAKPGDSVGRARQTMSERNVHQLVVLDGKEVVGVVCSHDLAERRGGTVREVMTPDPVVAAPRTTIRDAANFLRGQRISALPVVEDGRVVGIVTVTDLLELIGRGVQKPISESVRWTMKGRGPRRRPQKPRSTPSTR
jgi:CBS domain-containing protein